MARWYDKAENQAHQEISQVVSHLKAQSSDRMDRDVDHLRLWGSDGASSYSSPVNRILNRDKTRYNYNVIQQTVNTLVSKIGKRKPRVVAQPFGGTPEVRRESEKLSQLLEGQFSSTDLYRVSRGVCRDAMIYGTGVLKVVRGQENNVVLDKVPPFELYVDELDGIKGKPSELFQVSPYPRDALEKMYPQFESQISAAAAPSSLTYRQHSLDDFVEITEAWKLPLSPTTPGRHVISIDGATLLDEEWNHSEFPFVFYRWLERPIGFWGMGVAEQLRGIQTELGKLLQKIQKSMHLLGSPYIVLDANSKIKVDHLNNRIGTVLRTNGKAPQVITPGTVHPEVFNHVERLYRRAFEIVGLSELSATSRKPSGLDSGVALREYSDIETERFMEAGQSWSEFFLSCAEHILSITKEIQEDLNGDLTVKVPGKEFITSVNWKEIDLEDDQYQLRLFDVGFLPVTPAGRLAKVQELLQAGLIPQEAALELLDIPDLQEYEDTTLAKRKLVKAVCNDILDQGILIQPEPTDNLEFTVEYGSHLYSKARLENLQDEEERWQLENMEKLRVYVATAAQMSAPLTAPPTPELPPGPPALPPGLPGS